MRQRANERERERKKNHTCTNCQQTTSIYQEDEQKKETNNKNNNNSTHKHTQTHCVNTRMGNILHENQNGTEQNDGAF